MHIVLLKKLVNLSFFFLGREWRQVFDLALLALWYICLLLIIAELFAICKLQMKKKCTQIFYLRICIKLHALCNLQAICVGKIPCHVHVMEARLQEVMRAQLEIIIQNLAARKIIGPAIKARTKIDSLIHEKYPMKLECPHLVSWYHHINSSMVLSKDKDSFSFFLWTNESVQLFEYLNIFLSVCSLLVPYPSNYYRRNFMGVAPRCWQKVSNPTYPE